MTKEIKVRWNLENGRLSLTVQYILRSDKGCIAFTVRAPTEDWHYWLPTGIDIHSKTPTSSYNNEPYPCDLLPEGQCYADGTSLGAEKLWRLFNNGFKPAEDIIWNELESWAEGKI